jgi:hypothetical protein
MPIPEAQLETWSSQGAITTSASTYQTIRNALEASTAGYAGKDHKIFLQGSYGNDTNIFKESDVDVVIRLDDVYFADISRLSTVEQAAYNAAFVKAQYTYSQYKTDVVQALTNSFGTDVKGGKKAIKITSNGSRRSCDVIPACAFRRYTKFQSSSTAEYTNGICFFDQSGGRIDNYPKQHSANCTEKHQATGKMFKGMVRIFKNVRTKLVADGAIASGLAPSYYIEGLLYNVPPDAFIKATYSEATVACLNWLKNADAAARNNFVCANYQYWLLHGPAEVTWTATNCDAFIRALIKMWNEWGK